MSTEENPIKLDPIFKGCTRPAMIGGVPMVPMIIVVGLCFILGMWGMLLMQSVWPPLIMGTVLVSLLYTMRGITRKDDQRFRQIMLWIILRKANKSKRHWLATSYSPIRFKRR